MNWSVPIFIENHHWIHINLDSYTDSQKLVISTQCTACQLKCWWNCSILHHRGPTLVSCGTQKNKTLIHTELLLCIVALQICTVTGLNLHEQWFYFILMLLQLAIIWNIWYNALKLRCLLSLFSTPSSQFGIFAAFLTFVHDVMYEVHYSYSYIIFSDARYQ